MFRWNTQVYPVRRKRVVLLGITNVMLQKHKTKVVQINYKCNQRREAITFFTNVNSEYAIFMHIVVLYI